MSLVKKDIVNNISNKASLSFVTSSKFLEKFLILIKENKEKNIILPNFGTFYYHKSPKRTGRNPKTKESFNITSRKKLNLKVAKKIKSSLN